MDKMTRHHIVPRHWPNGIHWSNHYLNLKNISQTKHRAFHTLFDNQLIDWQIKTLLNMSLPAIREEIRSEIIHILEPLEVYDLYNKKCFYE